MKDYPNRSKVVRGYMRGMPKLCYPVSSSIILTLNLPPQLRWDCGRIVNCAGIETIAILISATFVNTALSTVNLNYIVHCLGGLSPMSLRCLG